MPQPKTQTTSTMKKVRRALNVMKTSTSFGSWRNFGRVFRACRVLSSPVSLNYHRRNNGGQLMTVKSLGFLAGCLFLAASLPEAWAQPRSSYQQTQYKGQEIGKLTGDVYYARMDDYVSVFMVTSEGIVLVEPIGTEFATWLKGELATRFKVPVKYVIYSHHHWDHGSGAAVYADTARIIGHEAMIKRLAMPPADTPLPQNVRAQDANGNGRIEESEAQGNIKAQFAMYDANRDGALSGAEVTRGPLAFVVAPDLTYTDRVTITLGGKRVEV